jgi:hypothetical protein
MSNITATSVTVDRETLLGAIAMLFAADRLFVVLNEHIDSDLGQYFTKVAHALKNSGFGDEPENDDAYATDPVIVELEARCDEIAGELLATLGKSRELAFPMRSEALWRESFEMKFRADRMRKAGTIHA